MSSDDPNWIGYFYSFLLFLISFLESTFESQYEFYLGVLQMKVKTCLISTVYKKALVLSTDGRKEFSTGQIVNLMSVDVQAIVDYISFSMYLICPYVPFDQLNDPLIMTNRFHLVNVVWSSPVQLFVCFYLVW